MRVNIKRMATSRLGTWRDVLLNHRRDGVRCQRQTKIPHRNHACRSTEDDLDRARPGPPRGVCVFDPNCGYCQLLYKNLQTFIAPYNLQLRWIPVAIVDATSLGKAAAIMQAKDPKAALDNNEAHYNTNTYTGGISEEIPFAGTEARLRVNEALLNQVGIPVVPTMLFQAKSGEAMVIQGALSPIALRKVLDRVR
jgi:thiol:disulfide interchange protein DsbG